jgi:aminotransferase
MNNSDSSHRFVAQHMMDVPRSGIRDFFEIVSTRDDVISLGIGEPNFVTPQHVLDVAIDALKHGETGYTDNLGILELRQEISKYVKSSFGVEYTPETEILVTVGVSEALDLAIRAITEPGDEIIYHEPGYVSYAPTIIFAHGKPVRVCTRKEDDFSITRAQVEEKITDKTKALLLNFPTNPTGAVLERKDVEEIAELCIERDILVITDEVYSELTYDNAEHVSIASIPGMKERTILLHGFSKAWAMTGFRMGFSCTTPTLTAAMMKIHQYSMMCAPTLSQIAAIEALANGGNDIIEMRDDYQKRRDYIVSSFNEMGIPCHAPKGAFYAFPYIGGTGLTSHEFAMRLLEEKKVACVPGTAFGAAGEGFLRASYATDMDKIKEAMPLMADFIASLK